MTIKEILLKSYLDLSESQILLSHILNCDRLFLTVHSDKNLSEEEEIKFSAYVSRRKNGEPLSYITEKREFYGREFKVSEDTLIPRPETELLIDEVKKLYRKTDRLKILDLCTGSGCIGITLSCEFPFSRVLLSDISSKALITASDNVCILGQNYIMGSCEIIKSNMFETVPKEKYDLIVSNPPYIPSNDIETLDEDVKREPMIALDGGEDGLDFYRIIFDKNRDYLKETGNLLLEIGYNQSEFIKDIAFMYGFECVFAKDIQGYNRCAVCKIR